MKLHEFIHGHSRSAWNLRLVIYVAVVVTLCASFQVVRDLWFS